MYFVTLLLEFNHPSQKLMEHIDAQEARRVEMAPRLLILPEANKRLMVYIGPEAFTMGARDEDSPRNE